MRRLNPDGDIGGEVARQWGRVYEAWREVCNALYRGYSSAGFAAWTVPALYIVGRWLRMFAIRADEESRKAVAAGAEMGGGGLGEDDVGEGNERLEDCARQINKLFSLCVSDRYVSHQYTRQGCVVDAKTDVVYIVHLSKNLANGPSTTPPTFSSRPTSALTASRCARTSFARSLHKPRLQTPTSRLSLRSPSRIR